MRVRTARKANAEDKMLAAIETLEGSIFCANEDDKEEVKIADADTELVVEEKAITVEDKKVVNESVPVGDVILKNVGDQNDKMQKNWPVSASEKMVIARRLVAIAKQLITD